ncbi:MAG TPA: hypothetical protein PLR20_14250 [Syntrophales bacterium]|nr:hypothetical protein [Syntrophales bacterium]HOX94030.1 hypothetical protein [Syntrophales bacterium]HPI58312.1 hypothetical protein [Syntrophales bacterium]HPN26130.1 hypothetical protein [Syntrophales bacterium]HQM30507.1 hypothetical protein [Syntrophales bacterium]
MGRKDPVTDFLKGRGCPAHVVRGGLTGLIDSWEATIASVARGYTLGLDDYLNDMDGRQLIEEALGIAPDREKKKHADRLRRADARMKKLLAPAGNCLWGTEVAEVEGWSERKNWWYFMKPLKAGPDLLAEIEDL